MTALFWSAHPAAVFRRASVLAVLVALLFSFVGVPGAEARIDDKSKPVLFVHGYNATSNSTDCGADFDKMIAQLRAEGFTGPMVKIGFYSGDVNCNVNLRSYGSFGDSSSWKTISMAMSNYVHQNYTSKGVAVDIVGYSMGGLISRGAVHGSQRGDSGFSPRINVEDVVTLGTPHNGAAWYSNLCLWGQCTGLKPGSSELSWLNLNGNPQGLYGTEFTAIASNGDAVVPTASALYMSIPSTNKVTYSSVPHTGTSNYMNSAAVVTRSGNGLAYANQ
jgi:triacylglycerol esterase/lipase EstA (alpha/beta hydrolase family)